MNTPNYNLIKEMFTLQDKFNEIAVTDWRDKDLPWKRAVWLECAEAVESLDWKWWKHQEADMDNVKVELVDIWHFLMSFIMVHKKGIAERPEDYNYLFEVPDEIFMRHDVELITMIEDLAGLVLEPENPEHKFAITIFYSIWQKMGFHPDDLYREYVIKNTLNKFRQSNGYKTGEYIKLWSYEGKEVEDNVVTWSLAQDLELSENMSNELFDSLTAFYDSMPHTKG